MPREFYRSDRLGAQILRCLSELLRFETKDPALAAISLTDIDLSRDLSVAKVYFGMLNPDDDPQPALDGLARANGFLRSRLGRMLKVHHVPELRFFHDNSAEHGAEITRLLESARDL